MKPCKRIEIVLDQTLRTRLETLLKSLGVDAYTIISDAGGLGDRGYRRADDVTGTSSNCIFIVALNDDEHLDPIIEGIRSVLSSSGGMCLLSDASFVKH